jgi:hypothetical protein
LTYLENIAQCSVDTASVSEEPQIDVDLPGVDVN